MTKHYDLSKSKHNPYAKRLKASVTIRLDPEVIEYFKRLAAETAIPYQTLINLYLRDCAQSRQKLKLNWSNKSAASRLRSRRKLKAMLAKLPYVEPEKQDHLPVGLTRRRKRAG